MEMTSLMERLLTVSFEHTRQIFVVRLQLILVRKFK